VGELIEFGFTGPNPGIGVPSWGRVIAQSTTSKPYQSVRPRLMEILWRGQKPLYFHKNYSMLSLRRIDYRVGTVAWTGELLTYLPSSKKGGEWDWLPTYQGNELPIRGFLIPTGRGSFSWLCE